METSLPITASQPERQASNGILATPSELQLGGSQAMFGGSNHQISSRILHESPSAALAGEQRRQNSDALVSSSQGTDAGGSRFMTRGLSQGRSIPRVVVGLESEHGRSESAATVTDSHLGNITPRTITPRASSPGSLSGSPWLQPADAPPLMNTMIALNQELERNDAVIRTLLEKRRRRSPKPETERPEDTHQEGAQDAIAKAKGRDLSSAMEVPRLTTVLQETESSSVGIKKSRGELEELRLLHDRDQRMIQELREELDELRGELRRLREHYWDMSYDYRDLKEDFDLLQNMVEMSIPIDHGNDGAAGLSRLVQKTPNEARQEKKIGELMEKLKRLEKPA